MVPFDFNGHCRHSNFLVFQLMLGLCLFNQGMPKMILCFPNLVNSSRVVFFCPFMVNSRSTKEVIFPFLFSIPSTFRAIIGSSRSCVLKPALFTQFWSMNSLPAPLSMSPRVLTFSFLSVFSIEIGIDKEYDFIVASVTEKTSSVGEIDVDLFLHFKNPLLLLLCRIHLFLSHSFLW